MEDLTVNQENQGGQEQAKEMGFFQRVLGVIVSPTETMKNLAAKPRILFPILLVAFSTMVMYIVLMPMFREATRHVMDITMQKTGQTLSPEQLSALAQIQVISSIVLSPIMAVVMWLIGGAILLAGVKIFKGEGNYKQFLSVSGYSYVIMALSMLLTVVLTLATGTYNMGAPYTSLAVLLPADAPKNALFGILSGIEIFTIWRYIVIGIGLAVVGKLSKAKAFSIAGVLYVLVLAFSAVSMAIGGKYI